MPDAAARATGSCLCGAVTFAIAGTFDRFYLCHCGRCRKGTGSAHAANLFARGAALAWLSGEEMVRTYRLPGTRHGRAFCRECGSALPRAGATLVVPAGCLDTPVDVAPDAHICWADRADWDEGLETVPRLDGLPG